MIDIESRIERIPESGCWVWMKTVTHDGYPRLGGSNAMRNKMVHRLAYEQYIGPIPEGLQLDHLCNVPCCVNPYHLEPVTGLENTRRAIARRSYKPVQVCKYGHAFDLVNTKVRKDGKRQCSACRIEYENRRRAQRALQNFQKVR